ncbi:unnamed protein product [Nyctereutes procyonoides]|uniref:(raccoon dog) hypothetical protein n=1 Tax=Nyctereutes procyonoides TaxID=34880 RepID=A0A811YJK0_NYCPR|nr:unnamed protein product [Nyctereutes procyonoides]
MRMQLQQAGGTGKVTGARRHNGQSGQRGLPGGRGFRKQHLNHRVAATETRAPTLARACALARPGAATPSSREAASAAGPHLCAPSPEERRAARSTAEHRGPAPRPGPASSPAPAPAGGRHPQPRGPARRAARSASGAVLWQPRTRPLAPRLLPGHVFPSALRSSRKEEKQNITSLL